MLIKGLFSAISPGGSRARLSILIFHRVLPAPDPLFPGEIDASAFHEICGRIASWFRVLPLDAAIRHLQSGTLPPRALAITFDDGYADNHDVAMPILQSHRLPATFFIATGFLDGGRMWNDTVIESVRHCRRTELDLRGTVAESLGVLPLRTLDDRRAAVGTIIAATKYLSLEARQDWVTAVSEHSGACLSESLMMSSEQVRAMAHARMGIGAHTVTHPILAGLDTNKARAEITEGRRRLEELTGERVGLFAYPNGKPGTDYNSVSVSIVRELGFDAAVSTAWGAARADDDVFQLPRFTPWDRTPGRFAIRMAANLLKRTH